MINKAHRYSRKHNVTSNRFRKTRFTSKPILACYFFGRVQIGSPNTFVVGGPFVERSFPLNQDRHIYLIDDTIDGIRVTARPSNQTIVYYNQNGSVLNTYTTYNSLAPTAYASKDLWYKKSIFVTPTLGTEVNDNATPYSTITTPLLFPVYPSETPTQIGTRSRTQGIDGVITPLLVTRSELRYTGDNISTSTVIEIIRSTGITPHLGTYSEITLEGVTDEHYVMDRGETSADYTATQSTVDQRNIMRSNTYEIVPGLILTDSETGATNELDKRDRHRFLS